MVLVLGGNPNRWRLKSNKDTAGHYNTDVVPPYRMKRGDAGALQCEFGLNGEKLTFAVPSP